MNKKKQGEEEAAKILNIIGIEIEDSYCDDNSMPSMPDLKCKDGRYVEVTHTYHDHPLTVKLNNYHKSMFIGNSDSLYNYEIECYYAIERVRICKYEKDSKGNLTESALCQYKKDKELIKKHLGYDITQFDFGKQHSEFGCDIPSREFSPENVLREVIRDKGHKNYTEETDLFIFVTEDEFRLMKELLSERKRNGTARNFLEKIANSKFPKIYICEWDYYKQEYNIENPNLVIFYKEQDTLKWICYPTNLN